MILKSDRLATLLTEGKDENNPDPLVITPSPHAVPRHRQTRRPLQTYKNALRAIRRGILPPSTEFRACHYARVDAPATKPGGLCNREIELGEEGARHRNGHGRTPR